MSEREELIKEAALAIRDLDAEFDFNNGDDPLERYDALIHEFARAAFAVFDKHGECAEWPRAEPQGEPSDVRSVVDAATRAWSAAYHRYASPHDAMRAALRAAGEAKR